MSVPVSRESVGYASRYDPDVDFDRWYTTATGAAIRAWLQPGETLLELGCATGLMSVTFEHAGVDVVGIDREESYLARARGRGLARATFIRGDVEDVGLGRRFDHVVATNIVHEVRDPAAFFSVCERHLETDGRLHVSLQNPDSIHRIVGQALGLIDELTDISERGVGFSTMRMMSADDLVMLGREAGLRCVHRAGVMLKPLPNSLMQSLPDATLEGFVKAAHRFPANCAVNYLVFEPDRGQS
jgi:2-polyprenyl-3-methyl-5-hydroxy-6-metoxy-1,4-benzoquinol methylase